MHKPTECGIHSFDESLIRLCLQVRLEVESAIKPWVAKYADPRSFEVKMDKIRLASEAKCKHVLKTYYVPTERLSHADFECMRHEVMADLYCSFRADMTRHTV